MLFYLPKILCCIIRNSNLAVKENPLNRHIFYIYIKFFVKSYTRQIPYDTTYMWDLKYGTNEPVYKTETD